MGQTFLAQTASNAYSGIGADSELFFGVPASPSDTVWVVRSWEARITALTLTAPVTRLSFRAMIIDGDSNEIWSKHMGIYTDSPPMSFLIAGLPYLHSEDACWIEVTPDDLAAGNKTLTIKSSIFYLEITQPT